MPVKPTRGKTSPLQTIITYTGAIFLLLMWIPMPQNSVRLTHNAYSYTSESVPLLLRGRLLLIAKTIWITLTSLSVALFLAGVPNRYQQLSRVCSESECGYLQLSFGEVQALLDLDLSLNFYAAYNSVLAMTLMLVFTILALAIFRRRSTEWMALLVSFWLVTFGANIFIIPEVNPFWSPLITFLDQLSFVFLLPLFLLIFPDGRFIPRWTRGLFIAWLAFGILGSIFPIFTANEMIGVLAWIGMQLVGVSSQVYRYLRVSGTVQRQQTKWVVIGLLAAVVTLAVFSVAQSNGFWLSQSDLSNLIVKLAEPLFVSLAFIFIPLSFSFSILRFRLWDIDTLINRTLVYGTLTVIVAGFYVLIVGGLGVLVQARGNLIFSIVATGLIALLLLPVRQRLQLGVNRIMYGERDDPFSVMVKLGQRLEDAIEPEAAIPAIVTTVAQALKLPYTAIALRDEDGFRLAYETGGKLDSDVRIYPMVYRGETVGQLLAAPNDIRNSFNPYEEKLLKSIAAQASTAVQAFRLTHDLRTSRTRIVTAVEEERQRLRRDLHDGLGPELASQGLKLVAARRQLVSDPQTAAELLEELIEKNKSTVSELRHIVYGLRPPTLDTLGLVEAVKEHVRGPSPDALTADSVKVKFNAPQNSLPKLSAATEVAAYRIALEGVTNIHHHSKARNCEVSFSIDENNLILTISDDGVGISSSMQPGMGLISMRARAEELGGELEIISGTGNGTRLVARLPLKAKEYE